MYTYIHTYIVYSHTYIQMYMYVCLYMYVYVCMYMCAYICMYMYVCMYVCICMCVYMYVCVCVFVCIHVYVCMHNILEGIARGEMSYPKREGELSRGIVRGNCPTPRGSNLGQCRNLKRDFCFMRTPAPPL